ARRTPRCEAARSDGRVCHPALRGRRAVRGAVVSIESVTIALHHSRAVGAAKLVLIGIANHDGDGGSWPSVATLAKYAGITPRHVRRAVGELEQLHEIRRHVQRGGTAFTEDPRRPNL